MVIEHEDCTFTWVCDTCGAGTIPLPLWSSPEYKRPEGWIWEQRRNSKHAPEGVQEHLLGALRQFHNSFQFCSQECRDTYAQPEDYEGVPDGGLNMRVVAAYMDRIDG